MPVSGRPGLPRASVGMTSIRRTATAIQAYRVGRGGRKTPASGEQSAKAGRISDHFRSLAAGTFLSQPPGTLQISLRGQRRGEVVLAHQGVRVLVAEQPHAGDEHFLL